MPTWAVRSCSSAASFSGSASAGFCRRSRARFRWGHRSRLDLSSCHWRYARPPIAMPARATTASAAAPTRSRFSLAQATARPKVEMNSSGPLRSRRVYRIFSAMCGQAPWWFDLPFACAPVLYIISRGIRLELLPDDRGKGVPDLLRRQLLHLADLHGAAEPLHAVAEQADGVLPEPELREGLPHDGEDDPR